MSGRNGVVLLLSLIGSCLVAVVPLTCPLSPRSVDGLKSGLVTASKLSIDIAGEAGERLGEHESFVVVSSDRE